MNELENEMLPFANTIRILTKELGYDPSEGCTTFQEVLDKLPENENIKIEYSRSSPSQSESINLKIFDPSMILQDKKSDKEIQFLIQPNASIVVNDKITEKRRTYIPPVPQISGDELKTLENRLKEFDKRKQKRQTNKNKQKTSIFSSIINKIKKQ